MRRVLAIAAMLALWVPSVAAAQGEPQHGGPQHGGPQHGGPSHGGPPRGAPHGPPSGAHGGPPSGAQFHGQPGGPAHAGGPPGAVHVGGPAGGGAQFTFHGHAFDRVHLAPFAYPPGYAYQRWAVGGVLPPLFLVPSYYYTDWASLGLDAPPPGTQWVRYGPDLLLVDVNTGQVVDVIYDAFY
jgi:hypothetical protein